MPSKQRLFQTLLTLSLPFLYWKSSAQQDTLFHFQKDTILCNIVEVNEDVIKYKTPAITDDIVFVVQKDQLWRAVTSKGIAIETGNTIHKQEKYADQRKHALKLNLLGPINNLFTLGYERSIRKGRSWDAYIGYVGPGQNYDSEGVHLRVGYKFIKNPDFYKNQWKYAHLLKGTYIKPELSVSHLSGTQSFIAPVYFDDGSFIFRSQPRTVRSFGAAMVLNLGYQEVFNDLIVIDLYAGVGYGFREERIVGPASIEGRPMVIDTDRFQRRGSLWIANSGNLAFTLGFRIGVLLR